MIAELEVGRRQRLQGERPGGSMASVATGSKLCMLRATPPATAPSQQTVGAVDFGFRYV